MKNFKIFQNSLVWKILREDVNFPNLLFLKNVPICTKIMRQIFTRDIFKENKSVVNCYSKHNNVINF